MCHSLAVENMKWGRGQHVCHSLAVEKYEVRLDRTGSPLDASLLHTWWRNKCFALGQELQQATKPVRQARPRRAGNDRQRRAPCCAAVQEAPEVEDAVLLAAYDASVQKLAPTNDSDTED